MINKLAELLIKHNVSISCEEYSKLENYDTVDCFFTNVVDNDNESNNIRFMFAVDDSLDDWINQAVKPAINTVNEQRKDKINI